jgi:hypothetical protein
MGKGRGMTLIKFYLRNKYSNDINILGFKEQFY